MLKRETVFCPTHRIITTSHITHICAGSLICVPPISRHVVADGCVSVCVQKCVLHPDDDSQCNSACLALSFGWACCMLMVLVLCCSSSSLGLCWALENFARGADVYAPHVHTCWRVHGEHDPCAHVPRIPANHLHRITAQASSSLQHFANRIGKREHFALPSKRYDLSHTDCVVAQRRDTLPGYLAVNVHNKSINIYCECVHIYICICFAVALVLIRKDAKWAFKISSW